MIRKTSKLSSFIISTTVFLLCLYLLSVTPFFVDKVKAQWSAPPPVPVSEEEVVETSEMQEMRQAVEERPNFIQYNAYTMLRHKMFSDKGELDRLKALLNTSYRYEFELEGTSPLSLERWGGLWGETGGSSRGMDLLTGQTAIDEALHLRGGSSGELTGEKSVSIDEIEPLEIKSHPWKEMMDIKRPIIHPITEVIPNDYFVVYFRNLSALGEIEDVFSEFTDVFGNFYNLKNAKAIRERVYDELGIRNDFDQFVDDVALVLYDVELFSNTDYALILELKGGVASKTIASLIVDAPSENHGAVGDFYVIATNPLVLEDIEKTHSGQRTSLADLGDYLYTLSVLGDDYDGFIFISDDFVRKLTSPEYRFSYWRRNEAFDVLETLQYVVFGYREITGKWPESLDQIINEGYISDAIAESDRYRIDEKGIIHHREWGSIYDITPNSRIDIESVTPEEAEMYERFKKSYHEMWVNFIDPVGIAINVEDHISLHTVILPLVEESQYDWLRAVAGRDPMTFSFLQSPDRVTDAQVISQFNIDDILFAFSQWGLWRTEENLSREETVRRIKDDIAKEIEWKRDRHPLDALGDEVMLGFVLDGNLIDDESIEEGIVFGIEITDEQLIRDFIDHLNEMEFEFIKSAGEHQGVEYFTANSYFFRASMAFVNNRMYVTISEDHIKKVIEGGQNNLSWSNNIKELIYHIRNKNNIMAFVNMGEKKEMVENLFRDGIVYSSGPLRDFVDKRIYRNESLVMEEMLEGETGDFAKYYRYMPENWFKGKLINENNNVYLDIDNKRYDANDMKIGGGWYDVLGKEYSHNLFDLIDDAAEGVTFIPDSFETLGVGFQFTPHGLDIRVAINNPYQEVPADRDLSLGENKEDEDSLMFIYLAILGLFIILLIVGVFIYRSYNRSRNKIVPTPENTNYTNETE
jgi:hypothetical protein